MKYTPGELRAWRRGRSAFRDWKPITYCRSKDPDYLAAWKGGWLSAQKEQSDKIVSQTARTTGDVN